MLKRKKKKRKNKKLLSRQIVRHTQNQATILIYGRLPGMMVKMFMCRQMKKTNT